MPKQQILSKMGKTPTKYPGILKSLPELMEEYPDGLVCSGKEYADQLQAAAAVMNRKRENPVGHVVYGDVLQGYSWEWIERGCEHSYVPARDSADKLNAIEWRMKDEEGIIIRLREDGLLTLAAAACPIVNSASYMSRQLTRGVSRIGWSVWTPNRGTVFPDPVVPDGEARLGYRDLQAVVWWFKREHPKRRYARDGNNYYTFTDVMVKKHPSLPDRSVILFVLKKPIFLGGGCRLVGAMCESAIVASILDDGTLAINSGWADPVEELGIRGRDSGAMDKNDYSSQPLFNLWEHVCSQLAVGQ